MTKTITNRKTAIQKISRTLKAKATTPAYDGLTIGEALDQEIAAGKSFDAAVAFVIHHVGENDRPARQTMEKATAAEVANVVADQTPADVVVSRPGGAMMPISEDPATNRAIAADLNAAASFVAAYLNADDAGRRKLLGWKPLAPVKAPAAKTDVANPAPADDRRRLTVSDRPTICGMPVAHVLRHIGIMGGTPAVARQVIESPDMRGRIANVPDGPVTAESVTKRSTLNNEVTRSMAGHPGYQNRGNLSAADRKLIVRLMKAAGVDVK